MTFLLYLVSSLVETIEVDLFKELLAMIATDQVRSQPRYTSKRLSIKTHTMEVSRVVFCMKTHKSKRNWKDNKIDNKDIIVSRRRKPWAMESQKSIEDTNKEIRD